MKRLFTIGAILLAFIMLGINTVSVQAQNPADRNVLNYAQRVSGDRFTVYATTPKGARIYAVKTPTAPMLREIDKGLSDLFAIARKNGYNTKLNYSDYVVFIALPDRLKDIEGKYSPDFAIPVKQYAGSVYDKGGYMYAAGMVMSYNPCAFMIAEHEQSLNRVSEVVRYEGEHIILYHNDRKRYNDTADHSKGGGHPILQ